MDCSFTPYVGEGQVRKIVKAMTKTWFDTMKCKSY
jgi:hypothetical protein